MEYIVNANMLLASLTQVHTGNYILQEICLAARYKYLSLLTLTAV